MMRLLTFFFVFILTSQLLIAQSVGIGNKQFKSIQMAIGAAKPGDVIEIRGFHSESLKLNKKGITLHGENPENDGVIGVGGSVISADGQYGAENLTIENLSIQNGKTTDSPGGGILFKRVKGENILRNLVITRNFTDKVGGGLMIAASKATIENCWIHENYAKQFGGGMALQSGNISNTDIIILNSVISSNTSDEHGAGVYVNGNKQWGDKAYVNVSIENSIITYNSSGKNGGALFIKGTNHLNDNKTNTSLKLNHTTVAYNRSIDKKGGVPGIAFYAESGSEPEISIFNSLIALNGDEQEPDVNFAKSIVLKNTGNIYGKLMGLKVTEVDMSASKVVNKAAMIGLSDKLTKAQGSLMPELSLTAESPAIDKADANTSLKKDINGKVRAVADIGAVEFN